MDLPNGTNTTTDNRDTTLNFRIPASHGILGNMGESLAFGDDLDDNDVEETEIVLDHDDGDIEEVSNT